MTQYYIDAANGSNSNSGTSVDSAFADFTPVSDGGGSEPVAGDTITVLPTAPVTTEATADDSMCYITSTGDTAGEPITIESAGPGRAVVDCPTSSVAGFHLVNVQNFVVRDIHIKNSQGISWYVDGGSTSGDLVNCVASNGGRDDSSTHDHYFHNGGDLDHRGCISYDCRNSNGDGFISGVELSGESSRYFNCVSVHDFDGGFDAFPSHADATIEYHGCIAAYSGINSDWTSGDPVGNGSGFKSGGGDNGSGDNLYVNCVAYGCKQGDTPNGFRDNPATYPSEFYNCTTWDNGYGYVLSTATDTSHVVQNCISYQDNSSHSTTSSTIEVDNTWNLGITDPQIRSTSLRSEPVVDSPGSAAFLRIEEGSPARNAGTKAPAGSLLSTIPSMGLPDLGAYQYLAPSQRLPAGVHRTYDGSDMVISGSSGMPSAAVNVDLYHRMQPGQLAYHDGSGSLAEGLVQFTRTHQWEAV